VTLTSHVCCPFTAGRIPTTSAGRDLSRLGGPSRFCDNRLRGCLQVVDSTRGEMSEWLKEHAWKACVGETLPWVRIPLSPPNSSLRSAFGGASRLQARRDAPAAPRERARIPAVRTRFLAALGLAERAGSGTTRVTSAVERGGGGEAGLIADAGPTMRAREALRPVRAVRRPDRLRTPRSEPSVGGGVARCRVCCSCRIGSTRPLAALP
jgi:hypothetical protein